MHVREIEEYLGLLDLTRRIDVVTLPYTGEPLTRTVITQPGLRYTQVDALIQSLLQDPQMADLSFDERAYVLGRIRSEVAGRMLEELVLLHTKLALPDCEVCTATSGTGDSAVTCSTPTNAPRSSTAMAPSPREQCSTGGQIARNSTSATETSRNICGVWEGKRSSSGVPRVNRLASDATGVGRDRFSFRKLDG